MVTGKTAFAYFIGVIEGTVWAVNTDFGTQENQPQGLRHRTIPVHFRPITSLAQNICRSGRVFIALLRANSYNSRCVTKP